MGNKYSSQSISGYNSSPPADDGTVSEANKVKWATHKTKLADPIKTLTEAVNSAIAGHVDRGPTAVTTATTLDATHFNEVIEASGTSEITLTDASTLTAGWFVDIINKGSGNIPILRATASDTIDATSNDITLYPLDKIRLSVNAGADGFLTDRGGPIKDYYADTGAADAYVATPYPKWPAYAAGQKITLKIANANTGASTLNVSGLGVKNIKLHDGNDPGAGQIKASIHTFQYDGTNFILLNPFGVSAGNGSSLVLISTGTASASATLDFTGIDSTYSTRVYICDGILPATDATEFRFRVSTDNGSSFASTNEYNYSANGSNTTPGVVTAGGTGAGEVVLAGPAANRVGNASTEGACGMVYINRPYSSSLYTRVYYQFSWTNDSGNIVQWSGGGSYQVATAVDAVRFIFDSGNIASGVIREYGIKDA